MRVRLSSAGLLLTGCLAVPVAGCATIMHGTKQQVSISSTPTGARVTIDSAEAGQTPIVVELRRKDRHAIQVDLEGYQPYVIVTTRGTSGWVWGNIIFGGLIGLAVDAITGGLYVIRPDVIEATLPTTTAQFQQDGDRLVVKVVLAPEPGWQLIGTLRRQE